MGQLWWQVTRISDHLLNDESGIIIQNRLILFLVFLVASAISKIIYACFRKEYTIKGKNFVIKIEYGDLLQKNAGKKVITFDECYTTTVGHALGDVKPESINGQYLLQHNDIGARIGQLRNSLQITYASDVG